MTVDVMVNGRPWKVAIEPAGETGKLTVTIKGTARVIDVSWIDDDTLSLVDGDAVREIRLHARGNNGAVGVEIAGTVFETVASKERAGATASAVGATSAIRATGAMHVKAPMPGRVVRVLVGVGDRVNARQPVVVIEAMKMENELRSQGDGVVKEVLVGPGAAVESGAVLIVVDP